MRCFILLVLTGLLCSAGCSSRTKAPAESKIHMPVGQIEEAKKAKEDFVAARNEQPPEQKGDNAKPGNAKPRKIRYTATLNLIVEDLDKSADALDEARKEAKGEYARVEVNTSADSVRLGTWRVRVPVEHVHSFRKAVAKLGEVTTNTLETDDMTAQYYDLAADIENRKSAREALRDLLKETGKKEMKHYLEVWDKLEQVSNEINRKEGQLKLWADLTELTTVTVTLREKQKYIAAKPPEPTETPTFGMRAGKTWSESFDALLEFGEGVALVAIAVTPWLPVILLVGLVGWVVGRRVVRAGVAVAASTEGKK